MAGAAPFALSRGQRLRTAVGSVLTMQPDVLLLDEPTTGQDRTQIERLMGELHRDLDLVLFCTHDVDTAARHANRVVLLNQGQVIADGDPLEVLFDEPRLRLASVRQTNIQKYGARQGLRILAVDAVAGDRR